MGRALDYWKEGEKPATKPPKFSANNFADTWIAVEDTAQGIRGKTKKKRVRRATLFVQTLKRLDDSQWGAIIVEACQFIKKKPRNRSSSSTVVNSGGDHPDEDPDAGFVMDCNFAIRGC